MNEKHYNSAIAVRLRTIVDGRQWHVLEAYLDGLSNAQFRTAGYMLGEQYMPLLPDGDFWQLATRLVTYHAKAFLVTVLKSFCRSYLQQKNAGCENSTQNRQSDKATVEKKSVWQRRELMSDASYSFFQNLKNRPEDQRKVLGELLPVLNEPTSIEWLLSAMHVTDVRQRINAFVISTTPTTAFLLFGVLREVEDDKALLVRTTHFLMKRGDSLSFNLAALLRAFFGLDEVKGTFSLTLQPYELDRLTQDYHAFCKKIDA